MDLLVEVNRYAHIAVGFVGLAAWWVPIVTAKGNATHKRLGKVFVLAAFFIGTSAVLSPILRIASARLSGVAWTEILEDAGFLVMLGYLGIFTFNAAYYGVRVLRTRRAPEQLGTPFLSVLNWLMMGGSGTVALYAVAFWSPTSIIMLLLSPIGVLQGLEQRRYIARPPALKKPWFYAHMDAMLGAGIAFHTAFLVFGSRIVFDLSVLGSFNWVPWILPGLVGAIGGGAWKKVYMRKFGDLPAIKTPVHA